VKIFPTSRLEASPDVSSDYYKIHRNRVIVRDGFRCRRCKQIPLFPTLDHILPKGLGGSNRQDNLQLLCIVCHREKDKPQDILGL
jgi:5-methylcytosine-specific restriction endonuclease McrA